MATNLFPPFKIIVFSLLILIIALILNLNNYYGSVNTKLKQNNRIAKSIIESWKNLVKLPERNTHKKLLISIGTNTNVDLILSGTDLFNRLEIDSTETKNHAVIKSLKEFKETFKHFFQKGSAAERSFDNSDIFKHILSKTNDLNKQIEIGGNAALMAQNIATKFEHVDVILMGPIGPTLKPLLDKKIMIPFKHDYNSDEIHLILEYSINELFENLTAPAANRFIVSHDINNSEMTMLDDFFNMNRKNMPDIIIVSGLHLIETQNPDKRMQKLLTLKKHLKENILNNIVHLELASIGSIEYMQTIFETEIFTDINSLGLNEQELFFLAYSSKTAPHADFYKELKGQPTISKVIDILEWILITFGQSDKRMSKLTRIHFHCLIFHIVAVVDTGEWSNTHQALIAGTKIASKQASGLEFKNEANEIDINESVELKIDYNVNEQEEMLLEIEENNFKALNASNPVVELKRGRINFYLSPVLVCKHPKKTVGLGDSISSVGLVYSCFKC